MYFDVLTFGDRLIRWKAFLAFLLTIKVEYKCHDGVILNSIRWWSFATKIINEDTSNQTDAMRFLCSRLLEGPPLHIRSYVVIIRSSDAIYEIWLVKNTIAFVRCEWLFSGRFSFDFHRNLHIRATTHIQTRHQMFNKLHHFENSSYSAEDITLLQFFANVTDKNNSRSGIPLSFKSRDWSVNSLYFSHDEYFKAESVAVTEVDHKTRKMNNGTNHSIEYDRSH